VEGDAGGEEEVGGEGEVRLSSRSTAHFERPSASISSCHEMSH